MENEKVFPFRPQYISRLSDKISEEESNINKYGLFSLDIIEGFLAHLSQDILIQTPVSFFEFIPGDLAEKIDISSDKRFLLKEVDPFFDPLLKGLV